MTTESTLMTDQAPTDAGQQQAAPADAAAAPVNGQQPAAPAADATPKAPEQSAAADAGDYEITPPEGETLDEATLAAIKEQAKDLGLNKEQADKLAAAHLKQQKSIIEQQQAMVENAKTEWAERSKADKEFGGDQFNENLGLAKRALDTFASDELKTLMNSSGFGNHPEVIRLFSRIGKAISEDRLVTGKAPEAPADPAKRLFPNQQ